MLALGLRLDSNFDKVFSDINGIIKIQKLFIFFNTSSIIKCDFDPPPPIITLSGCERLSIILLFLNILKENKITHNLSHPDRVIVGGGGSNSDLIIEEVLKKINSYCILIIPLISLKSLAKLEDMLKPKVNNLTISQHQSYRGINIANDIRLSPLNPVFIIKCEIL